MFADIPPPLARASRSVGDRLTLRVVGPVVIGSTAQLVGLPKALAIPAVLTLFVALTAPALRASVAKESEPWEHVLR